MTPVAAPADKRFRRAKVSPARKRRWRLSWWTVARLAALGLVVGVVLYQTVVFVLASDALTVSRITVEGTHRMSRGEVIGLLDGLSGTSMVTADLDQWRVKLLDSPWVADASMRRKFPGTVAVVISERTPIGVGRVKDRLYLIDGTGAVIDEFGPNYADLDLPIVDGLSIGGKDVDAVDEGRAELAGRLMSELQRWPQLASQVSQIDVSDAHNAIVLLKGDTALVRVGETRFAERVRSYLDLRPALREQVEDIDYVDLRFDERVYVQPQRNRARGSSVRPAGLRADGAPALRAGASSRPGRDGAAAAAAGGGSRETAKASTRDRRRPAAGGSAADKRPRRPAR